MSSRVFAVFAVGILMLSAFLALAPFLMSAPIQSPSVPHQLTGLASDAIGLNAGNGGKNCNAATTCSVASFAVAANSAVLVGITSFSTVAPSAVAVLQAGVGKCGAVTALESSVLTAPTSFVYGCIAHSALTATVYVNFTASTYYDIEAADFTNVVIKTLYSSGTGTTSGSSTASTCAVTTTVVNEMVFDVVGVETTAEATITPLNGETQLQKFATTTNVVTQETQYGADAATGSFTSSATLASSGSWRTACVALLPASVPPAPTALTVGVVTTTTVPLTWTNPVGPITAGEVYLATYSGSCGTYSAVLAALTPFNSATVTGLTSGSTYCFQVTVSNSTGASAASTAVTNVRTLHVPPAATYLTVVPQAGTLTQLDVNWTLPTGTLLNQTLQRWTASLCGGASGTYTNIADPTTTLVVVTGLTAGTTYSYNIREWNATGEGVASSCVTATTFGTPSAPTGLSTTGATSSSVSLAWTNPTGTLYNTTVVYGTTCGGANYTSWTNFYSAGVTAATTVNGLASYQSYCFAIGAWSGGASSALSSTLTVVTLAGIPPQPINFILTGETATTGSFTWTNPTPSSGTIVNDTFLYGTTCGADTTGATGNIGTWTSTVNFGAVTTTYILTGLTPDTVYCASDAIWTQGGQGLNAAPVAFTTKDPIPSAPTFLTYLSASHVAVSMNWTQPTGIIVNDTVAYTTTVACASGLTIVSAGAASTITVSGLTAATVYYWEVAAWSSGGESVYSSCVVGATQGATPPAPFNLNVPTIGNTFAWLEWSNPIGYSLTDNKVYVSNPNGACGTWSQIIDLTYVASAFEVTGLLSATTYCIQVTAIDGESGFSNSVSFETLSGSGGGGGTIPNYVLPFVEILLVAALIGGVVFGIRRDRRSGRDRGID